MCNMISHNVKKLIGSRGLHDKKRIVKRLKTLSKIKGY